MDVVDEPCEVLGSGPFRLVVAGDFGRCREPVGLGLGDPLVDELGVAAFFESDAVAPDLGVGVGDAASCRGYPGVGPGVGLSSVEELADGVVEVLRIEQAGEPPFDVREYLVFAHVGVATVLGFDLGVEAVAQVRGRDVLRISPIAPVQLAARNLVATVLLAVGSFASTSSNSPRATVPVAAIQHQLAVPELVAAPAGPAPEAGGDVAGPVDWRTVAVREGDTAWGLASLYYGDGTAARQLWQDNHQQVQPDGSRWVSEGDPIEPGWVLRVRPDSTEPAAADPDPPATEVVTIKAGDSLWTVAEDGLGDRIGRPPATAETAPFWQETVDRNRGHLHSGDPDLVYPGEKVALPAEPAGVAAPPLPPSPPPPPQPPPPPPAPSTPTTTASPTTATPESTAPPLSTADDVNRSSPASEPDVQDDPSGEQRGDEHGFPAAQVTATAVLASLALAALARRRLARRRTARPGATTEARSPVDIAAEQELASVSDGSFERVQAAVDAYAQALQSEPALPSVAAMVVADDGVTVHLTEPTIPLAPFVDSVGEPGAWFLSTLALETRPPDEPRVPVLETLVTLGRTDDGRWVFVELESLGAVSVEGDAEQATALVRSIAAELVLQPVEHYIDVTAVGGLEPLTTVEQGRATAPSLDDTITHMHEQHGLGIERWVSTEGFSSTAAARAHELPRDGLGVAVLLAGPDTDAVLLNRIADAAAPGGKGLAVVSLVPLGLPAVQLVVSGGYLEVPFLGERVRAASLGREEQARLDELLDNEPTSVRPRPEDVRAPVLEGESAPYEAPAWDFCVRVFADLQVVTSKGDPVSFRYGENPAVTHKNTHRGPELLAYLALRPERSATRDEVRDHLWWGRSISTRSVDTLIGGTRKVLGGVDVLSAAQGDPGRRRYHLAPRVVTDVELLDHALAYARTTMDASVLDALGSALQHVEAAAFREGHMGAGLAEWASAHRVIDQVEQTLIEAALLAADRLREDGPESISNAKQMVDLALRACPVNEALVRAAMALDASTGDRETALSRYAALTTRLALDDLEPEPETSGLHIKLRSTTRR